MPFSPNASDSWEILDHACSVAIWLCKWRVIVSYLARQATGGLDVYLFQVMIGDTFDFLGLFPEIRENVFSEFALTPDAYVPLTATARDTRTRAPGSTRGRLYFSPAFTSSQPTSLPLLLVNRQLHGEFKACLQRLAGSKALRYELVVELVNERSIHPTWTLVPLMAAHIPVVYTHFRISNAPGETKGGWAYVAGDGGPGDMARGLLRLLQTFVHGGPLLGWNKAPQGWGGTVDALVLEVRTPEPVHGVVVRTRDMKGMRGTVHPAKHVVYAMSSHLDRVLSGGKHTLSYGRSVAACVKRIYLLLDGVEMKMWDVEAKSYLRALESE